MGYPHKPHPKETVVLSKHFGEEIGRASCRERVCSVV